MHAGMLLIAEEKGTCCFVANELQGPTELRQHRMGMSL